MPMNTQQLIQQSLRGQGVLFMLCVCGALLVLPAAADESETNAPPPVLTPEEFFEGGVEAYPNWIELSAGGFFTGGNQSEFQQRMQSPDNVFGGIEDFHYKRDLGKDVIFTMDGHAIFGAEDYSVTVDVTKWDLGYVRVSYDQYRTWSNGDGGYWPDTGAWYPHSDDALALDRGDLTFEAGLTLENVPTITFRYQHLFRDGQQGSTSWGLAQPDLNLTRGLAPSFYDIDDSRDIFELDIEHRIKATDFGVGVRYEIGDLNSTFNTTQYPDVPVLTQPVQDREGTTYDYLNVHAFAESTLRRNLLLSSAFAFNNSDNDFSGDRNYVPGSSGYTGLNGGSRMQEYLWNMNLMWTPWTNFSIVPSVRVQHEDWDADSGGTELTGGGGGAPFAANSNRRGLDVKERIDFRYTGFTNWVLYGRGEWTQGDGKLSENGGLTGFGPPAVERETGDTRFFQKYTAGVNWYPLRRVTLDAQYYFKLNDYDYDHTFDSTLNTPGSANRYPAYLVGQNFTTHDGNIRLRYRPYRTITLVTRYDFQYSTINTEPDSASGLSATDSAKNTSHIIGQNISWTPWRRLFLQLGFSYVLSEYKTPASDSAAAVPVSNNDYWTLNLSSGLVLSDKTDFNVGYAYYNTDNYVNNSPYVSYGAGGDQHSITCGIVHRLREDIRLNVRYGYFVYNDETFGGNEDFDAHLIYGSIQYRF